MRKSFFVLLLFAGILFAQPQTLIPVVTTIKLPEPDLNGKISFEQLIKTQKTVEQFTPESLNISQIGQLCWAAQGITEPNEDLKTITSAAMQLNVVLPDGLYLYYPANRSLEKRIEGDIRPMLRNASFGKRIIQDSPCIFIITGSIKKLEIKYRGRGENFAYIEAGRIAQNIDLQAISMGLGSAPIVVFDSKTLAAVCKLAVDVEPLYMDCIGNPVEKSSLKPAIAASPQQTQPSQQSDMRTKRVVIIVPPRYFSDTELFGTLNAFQIASIEPVIASSVMGEIKGVERNTITATVLVRDISVDEYDAFIFIGGPGVRNYFNNREVLSLAQSANKQAKIIAAIGQAPGIFARAGIVKGRNVASFTSQRKSLTDAGALWKSTSIEISGNMITASGPESSLSVTGGPDETQRFAATVLNMLRQVEQ